jgi:hypothetical protein
MPLGANYASMVVGWRLQPITSFNRSRLQALKLSAVQVRDLLVEADQHPMLRLVGDEG